MVIRRAVANGSNGQLMPLPHVIEASTTAETSTVSPLTNLTSVAAGGRSRTSSISLPSTPTTKATTPTVSIVPKPTMRVTQKTAGAMHTFCINKLTTLDHAKRALKRATKWYAEEKKRPEGLSSVQIAEKVKKQYDGVGPHPATICRYVNANLVGMSPLKPGVKGDIPVSVFKSLCIAVMSFVRIEQINSRQGNITNNENQHHTVLRHDYWMKMLQRVLLADEDVTASSSGYGEESLKRIRDSDATERSDGATSRDNNNNSGVQGLENGTIEG
jgi:hypothetical protein